MKRRRRKRLMERSLPYILLGSSMYALLKGDIVFCNTMLLYYIIIVKLED